MSAERGRWLARQFDLIGLSCDGPPDIQDRQRPTRSGSCTSADVVRTAGILRRARKPFHMRATITKDTLARQPEIARWMAEHFAPAEIRLEPVYANPAGPTELTADDAAGFVDGFLAARREASAQGIPVTTSLTRPGQLYGRHCNVLRNVLNLAPGDVATGCFLESRETTMNQRQVRVGGPRSPTRVFELDHPHIASLAARCAAIPTGCETCLCRFQCSYACPDVCALESSASAATFRCQAHRLLMAALIQDAARRAWAGTSGGSNRIESDLPTELRVAVCRHVDEEAAG
jgi:hypothetical protein